MNEPRRYLVVKDLSDGKVLLAYTVNGTTDTLHVSAECRDEAEAMKLLALLTPAALSAPTRQQEIKEVR